MPNHTLRPQEPLLTPIDQECGTLLSKTDPSQFEEFLQDASRLSGGQATAVNFPKTEEQVSEYLKTASRTKTPVTIAGNHTGLVAGAIPLEGEVLATALLTYAFPKPGENLLEIVEGHDELTNIPYQFYLKQTPEGHIHAVVPPGLRLAEFQKHIQRKGLFYPPLPTEENAFLGGNIATNASGACSFKYGSTRAHTRALRIALPTGDILHIERGKYFFSSKGQFLIQYSNNRTVSLVLPQIIMPSIKNAAGYFCRPEMDFIDLWIGSEGTLGIVTEIELTLLPKPPSEMSGIVFFKKEDDALNFAVAMRRYSQETWKGASHHGIDLRALEYFDSRSLELLRSHPTRVKIPKVAQAALYLEQESQSAITREGLEHLIAPLFKNCSLEPPEIRKIQEHPFGYFLFLLKGKDVLEDLELAFPEETGALHRLKEFRHILPVKVNEIIGGHKTKSSLSHLHKVATDTATPDDQLKPMMQIFKENLDQSGLQYVIFGHIGNNHLHANLLPKNEKELIAAKKIYLKLCRATLSLGGTVSAEHGIGKLKHSSLEIQYGAQGILQMTQLKKTLDPQFILGRENIFQAEIVSTKQ